jgi:hypothetical protein
MQLLTGIAFGSLMLTLTWRFNRSEWASMRVVDLPRELRARSGRRTLDEILMAARAELAINPTITFYEILEDGFEVGGPANPYAGLQSDFRKLTASFDRMGDSLAKFRDAFSGIALAAGEIEAGR